MVLNRRSAALCLLALAATACGGDDASSTASAPLLATTSIWADISSNVTCGADVPAVIPPGADPHTFEPSLRDRELLENADTVIANGLDLEESLTDLLDTVSDGGTTVIEMSIFVDVITDEHDEDDDDTDEHDDEHGHDAGGDPHIWQDPRRIAGALDVIGDAADANGLSTCTEAYRDELVALDAEIEAMISEIPPTDRVMVTSHDSLEYFADRYGLEIVGTVIPSTSTLAETNAADLAALADEIERRNVAAVFTEELESTADADALAERLGVQVVPLVTDALGDDPDTDSYVDMMRHNAMLIAEALAP